MRCRTITISSGRWPIVLLCGALLAWLSLSDASAHAAYESSTPAFAEVLDESPAEIAIRFTQELFRRAGANSLSLVQADSGAEIALGTMEIGNEDRRVMRVAVAAELSAGRYLVRWTNLSAEDGDADSGSYPFYVGRDPTADETKTDRALATELLIAYPSSEEAESETAPASPAAGPAVVRVDADDEVSLGVGPILWLAVGLAAALSLCGVLGLDLGRRRRARE